MRRCPEDPLFALGSLPVVLSFKVWCLQRLLWLGSFRTARPIQALPPAKSMAQMNDQIVGVGDTSAETLGRLSQKAGVQATVVVDRSTGSILKTTGQVSFRASGARPTSASTNAAVAVGEEGLTGQAEAQPIEEMASMVWNFVNAAGGLVSGLDTEDELKLLRLRTKKHELVIVPDAKYLLIVVHETPAA